MFKPINGQNRSKTIQICQVNLSLAFTIAGGLCFSCLFNTRQSRQEKKTTRAAREAKHEAGSNNSCHLMLYRLYCPTCIQMSHDFLSRVQMSHVRQRCTDSSFESSSREAVHGRKRLTIGSLLLLLCKSLADTALNNLNTGLQYFRYVSMMLLLMPCPGTPMWHDEPTSGLQQGS